MREANCSNWSRHEARCQFCTPFGERGEKEGAPKQLANHAVFPGLFYDGRRALLSRRATQWQGCRAASSRRALPPARRIARLCGGGRPVRCSFGWLLDGGRAA